jgi:hypothetical protein
MNEPLEEIERPKNTICSYDSLCPPYDMETESGITWVIKEALSLNIGYNLTFDNFFTCDSWFIAQHIEIPVDLYGITVNDRDLEKGCNEKGKVSFS